ncbi:dihydroxyacetone kinase subunit DhaK [Mycobacterium sp. smrl_JER01]|uniref:dihydroxyacetone kinase subunit DhaK n=1 Tax=Mycobacterium sp. smrl_JER01 TaxID=3402633 RepID=UPI003AD64647
MRKILNTPESVVDDYLAGLAAAHPDIIVVDRENRIILRAGAPVAGKVGIVAGGGSGCEPLHTGFVGPGMIDAAVAGQVFTSPVPRQIVAATRAVNGGAGVLHVIKNFPGEVMNFGMAEEILDFDDDDDIDIASVLVDDDVATASGNAGGRGLGATVLVERIAGAAAELGNSLAQVKEIAERVNARSRSFGVGLSSCTPPLRGRPIFDLPDGEIELGIGISGEPGRERAPMLGAGRLADLMLDAVLTDLRPSTGARLLVLVNGMGGTPDSELYLLYGEVASRLRERGFEPALSLVGSFVTSLDQAGAALTVLELDDELLELWERPIHTPALRWKA